MTKNSFPFTTEDVSKLPLSVQRAIEDLATDLEGVTGTRSPDGFSCRFMMDDTIPTGGYKIHCKKSRLLFKGGDAEGLIRGIYRFTRDVLDVDPLKHWTGMPYPRKEHIEVAHVRLEAPSPHVPVRCYFDNDNDELANLKEPYLQFDWPTWKAVIDTLLRLGYNAIDLHDHLGRSEFHRWPFYKNLKPDYTTDVDLLNQIIDYAHARGMLIQIPMYLQWAFKTITEDESLCWRKYNQKWLDVWSFYLEHTPIGKGDIFLNRPRDQLWDYPYRSSCGEDTAEVMTDMFGKLRDLILAHNPNAILVCDLYSEGLEVWKTGRFLPPKEYIMIWPNNGFGRFESLPGAKRHDYRFGAYLHAGYFLNHVVLDPYLKDIEESAKNIFLKENASEYMLVNGQTFRPFILNLEAYARAAEDPETFDAGIFAREWARRYWGPEAEAVIEDVFSLWHKASDRGYIHQMFRLTSLLDDWEKKGSPEMGEERTCELPELSRRMDLLEQAQNKLDFPVQGVRSDFLHDHLILPITLLRQLLACTECAYRAALSKDTEECLKALREAQSSFEEHRSTRLAGDRDLRWKGWYDPATRRPNGGFPTAAQFERLIELTARR